MADSTHQQTASVMSQGDKDLQELKQQTVQLNTNAQQFKEGAQELKEAMAQKQQVDDHCQKFMLGLVPYEDEFEALDSAGKARLAEYLADIMQQAQDDPDIGHTEEFWVSAQDKLLSVVLAKEADKDETDDDKEDYFDNAPDDVMKKATNQMWEDQQKYFSKINYPISKNIPLPEEASASAEVPKDSEDDKDLDPETKSKLKQLRAVQDLYNAADPKFCDMEEVFGQTMKATVDIMMPDEAQTFTFAQKQEQRCKEFMKQVNNELYTSKFKKVRISDEIKSNIEYAKTDLEARGYPVSDVETLVTSNKVPGQTQLFKHSIEVTLVE